MPIRLNKYHLLKWIVLIVAYLFLGYKLVVFENYPAVLLQWKLGLAENAPWLLLVFLLLPINWLLETWKWQFLLRKLEYLSIKNAFKSVMIGNAAAFFSPNRLGEFPGRSISLSHGKKIQGISLGVLGSVSQTICIMLFGIPSAIFYFFTQQQAFQNSLSITFALFSLLILLFFYFFLPQLCKYLGRLKLFHRVAHLLDSLTCFSFKDLIGVLFITVFRYAVFCLQFYALLRFFDVSLTPLEGLVAIAVNYLFITFTPSLAFSEGAVRASVAVLVIGTYSSNVVGIAAAGLFIWLINFVVPMLIGSVIFARKK